MKEILDAIKVVRKNGNTALESVEMPGVQELQADPSLLVL